jgi:hypothetical protein
MVFIKGGPIWQDWRRKKFVNLACKCLVNAFTFRQVYFMSCPGNPHLDAGKLVAPSLRPFSKLCLALAIVITSLPGCSSPNHEAASAAKAKPMAAGAPVMIGNFAEFQKTVQPFLAAHCYDCHGDKDTEGGVRFDILTSEDSLAKGIPTLEKAVKMLTARKMPPKDEPRPTENEYQSAIAWVNAYTNKYYMSGPIDPGRVTLHRLNRAEYNNTIHDLLAIDFDPADAFPVDDAGYGFDNNGDVLTVAPVLLEKYVTAASLSLKKAIFADPVLPPPVQHWVAATAEGDFPKSDPNAVTSSRNGSGGRAKPDPVGRVFQYYSNIYADYNFPADGDYILSFRGYGTQGNDGQAKALFYLDDQPIGKTPFQVNTAINNARVFATPVFHATAGKHRIYLSFRSNTTHEDYLAAVERAKADAAAAAVAPAAAPSVAVNKAAADTKVADAGAPATQTAALIPVLANTAGTTATAAANNPAPVDAKVADAATPTTQSAVQTPAPVAAAAPAVAVNNPATTDGKATAAAIPPSLASTPIPAAASAQGTGAAALIAATTPAATVNNGIRGAAPAPAAGTAGALGNRGGGRPPPPKSITGNATLAVVYFELEGPEAATPDRMPESYHRVMIVQPSKTLTKAQAAEKIIRNFVTRAFRRPATDDEVASYMELWNSVNKDNRSLEDTMSVVLQAVLVSPNFLFRVEDDPQPGEKGNIHTLNEYELASRLSYFLWSSMPDDELFALAAKGKLRANLDAQVDRMLKSPKAQALVDNFAGQWLRLRQVENVSPDPKLYPAFDPELRESMLKETQMFFSSIKDEDRSIFDFIDADYSFVNGRLAKFYGIDGITGDDFQRVTFPKDSPRGGLITQASVLTLTSYNNRTSPVQRGKWVLENLLDSAPPPPPPNVPVLDSEKQLTGTLRQQMEQHRANPTCAACHERMDAIGFSLENFDAIGNWRTKDATNTPIDASGSLPDGTTFNGARQLKQILLLQKDQFCHCLADKLLIYALGRGTEPSDKRTIDNIVKETNKNGDKFSSIIKAVVHSDAFQKRRGLTPADLAQSTDQPKSGDKS